MTGLSVDVDERLEEEAGEVIKQMEKSFTESFYQVAFLPKMFCPYHLIYIFAISDQNNCEEQAELSQFPEVMSHDVKFDYND